MKHKNQEHSLLLTPITREIKWKRLTFDSLVHLEWNEKTEITRRGSGEGGGGGQNWLLVKLGEIGSVSKPGQNWRC